MAKPKKTKTDRPYGYESFGGNISRSTKRSNKIDRKLKKLVSTMTCPMSLADIAKECEMSKQAIHQIEKRALRKIAKQHPYLQHELSEAKILGI